MMIKHLRPVKYGAAITVTLGPNGLITLAGMPVLDGILHIIA